MPAKTAEPANKTGDKKKLTIDDIKSMMTDVAKNVTREEFENIRKEFNDITRKSVFPHDDGNPDGDMQSLNDTIVDRGFFTKSFGGGRVYGSRDDMKAFASNVATFGGPFKRLGKSMETFAQMAKCRFDVNRYHAAGIDTKAYQAQVEAEYKAAGLSEGVSADGGYLVPVEYATTVIEFAIAQSPILSRVWTMPMSSKTLKIPRLVQAAGSYFGGITLYWTDEAAQKTKTKPAWEQLTFEAKKLIGLVYLTDELIDDSMINMVNYVTGLFTRAFQWEMERVVINGSGASGGQPLGIVQDPGVNIVARSSNGTVTLADVQNLDAALDENFRDLVWITRKKTGITLKGLRDNNQRPIFMEGYMAFNGEPQYSNQMFGYPVYYTRNCPAIGSQGDIILSDLGMYMLAMRQDIRIDTSIHSRFEYDETGIRFVARLDGQPAVAIAHAVLNDATS